MGFGGKKGMKRKGARARRRKGISWGIFLVSGKCGKSGSFRGSTGLTRLARWETEGNGDNEGENAGARRSGLIFWVSVIDFSVLRRFVYMDVASFSLVAGRSGAERLKAKS